MINQDQYESLAGREVVDINGDKIGKLGQIFLDNETGQAAWATVNTGLFGMKENFIPLEEAELRGSELVVPIQKDQVKDAPNIDLESQTLTEDDERRLYSYYDKNYVQWTGGSWSGTNPETSQSQRTTHGAEPVSTRLRRHVWSNTGR